MLIPAAGTPAAALGDGGGGGARKLILERNKPYLGVGIGSSKNSQGTSR
jgi:hypothetical protein